MLNTTAKKRGSIFRKYKAEQANETKNIWLHQASHVLVIAKAGWKTQQWIFPAPSATFMFEIFHTEKKIEKNDPREKTKPVCFCWMLPLNN